MNLTVQEIRKYMEEQFTCFARRNTGQDTLSNWADDRKFVIFSINHYGKFRVETNREIIHEGYDIWEAVKVYNEA